MVICVNPSRSMRARIWITALVVILAVGIGTYVINQDSEPASAVIGVDGGTVVSDDQRVNATFGPGEADPGTRVTVLTGVDPQAPLLQGLIPLSPVFSVTPTEGSARSGTVTVDLGPLPAEIIPEGVLMVVQEGSNWRVLDTAVDPDTGTATAVWPHFSRGYMGYLAPLGAALDSLGGDVSGAVSVIADITAEAWDVAKQRVVDFVRKEREELKHQLASLTLAVLGGTLDSVRCDAGTPDWTATENPPRPGLPAALNACVQPRRADGSWGIRVGNRAPFPYLVSLPDHIEVDWHQISGANYSLEDTLVALTLTMTDRMIVGGGATLGATMDPDTASPNSIGGYIDPISLSIKAAAIVAAYYTRGKSVEEAVALKDVFNAEADALYAEKARTGAPDLFTVIESQSWNSPQARANRKAALKTTADIADKAFTLMDFGSCLVGHIHEDDQQVDGPQSYVARAQTYAQLLVGDCFPVLVDLVFAGALPDQDLKTKLKGYAALVKAVVSDVQDIATLGIAQVAVEYGQFGDADYTHSKIDLTRAESPSPSPSPNPDPATGCADGDSPALDSTAQYAIHLDLDGYYRPHYRSEPTPVCGNQTLVVSYANSENATSSPEKIDVRVYDTTTQQWKVVQTLDPHDPQEGGSQPYVPSDNSCQGDCIRTAHVTDGDIDFLVQGGNATLANGLTVVSEKNGVWRMVPFLDKPPSTGSTNYVPAATLSGNDIHVDLNDCKPDCATGGHTTVAYTYNTGLQGFEAALVDDPGTTGGDGDLGLTVPIANQSCTGGYLTLIGSSIDPTQYQAEVQSFLSSHPGSSYLVTDQSCAALVSSVNGNRVYAAYLGPFTTAAQACAAGAAAGSGSYVKVLNNITAGAALVTC